MPIRRGSVIHSFDAPQTVTLGLGYPQSSRAQALWTHHHDEQNRSDLLFNDKPLTLSAVPVLPGAGTQLMRTRWKQE